MLFYNFTRLFKSRGIDKPFSYLLSMGYSANVATRIINHRIERVKLSDLEKLCELFKCTPNDLLEWVPGKNEKDKENHPLFPLIRNEKVHDLTQLLHSIPLNKLVEIEELIQKELDSDRQK